MSDKKLCQFYTKNSNKILKNMYIPSGVKFIIEPFCGDKDLLKEFNIEAEMYDIDPKHEDIIKRDTLLDPPDYFDKFIITNPPFRNKNKNKENYDIYKKYKCDDLYKCFILSFIDKNPIGGIIVLPLNFISSIRKNDVSIRERFVKKFDIILINVFEEQVFEDTSYNICSIMFKRKTQDILHNIPVNFYPSLKKIDINFKKNNNYTIGGEIYKLPISTKYNVSRAIKNKIDNITNIVMFCVDSSKKIRLSYEENNLDYIDNTPNFTMRTSGVICIKPAISLGNQKVLIEKFNSFLNKERDKYNSLFLTNYRDKYRKRISFDLVFKLILHLLIDF